MPLVPEDEPVLYPVLGSIPRTNFSHLIFQGVAVRTLNASIDQPVMLDVFYAFHKDQSGIRQQSKEGELFKIPVCEGKHQRIVSDCRGQTRTEDGPVVVVVELIGRQD